MRSLPRLYAASSVSYPIEGSLGLYALARRHDAVALLAASLDTSRRLIVSTARSPFASARLLVSPVVHIANDVYLSATSYYLSIPPVITARFSFPINKSDGRPIALALESVLLTRMVLTIVRDTATRHVATSTAGVHRETTTSLPSYVLTVRPDDRASLFRHLFPHKTHLRQAKHA